MDKLTDLPMVEDWLPGLVTVTPPPLEPLLPWASHSVAFRPSAALFAFGSAQPTYSVLPDWPVPSSMAELSSQNATRPLPNVLVTNVALVVPPGVAVLRYTSPCAFALSDG